MPFPLTRIYIIILGFIAGLAFFPPPLAGQEDDVVITRITGGHETQFNHVYDIAQDRTGFLWLGTNNGLFRYDGYTLKHYPLRNDSTTVDQQAVRKLLTDANGIFWVAHSPLTRFDPVSEREIPFNTNAPIPVVTDSTQLYSSRDGRIWITGEHLSYYSSSDQRFVTLPIELKRAPFLNGIIHSRVDTTCLWIASESALQCIDISTGKERSLPAAVNSPAEGSLTAFLEDHQGRLWVGTKLSLRCFDEKSMNLLERRHSIRVLSIVDNNDGTVIAAVHADASEMRLNAALLLHSSLIALPEIYMHSILQSNSGDFWFAARGVHRYIRGSDTVRSYYYEPGNRGSISSNYVTRLFQDRSGVLWAGTEDLGFFKIETRGKPFTLFTRADDNSTSDNFNVRALCEDHTGALWIGSFDGLHRFIPGKGLRSFFPVVKQPTTKRNAMVGAFLAENDALWVGYWWNISADYSKIDLRTGSVTNFTLTPRASFPRPEDQSRAIRAMLRDSFGDLWFATSNYGLYRVRTSSVSPEHYTPVHGDSTSISSDLVFSLFEGRDHTLWVGTSEGLDIFDRNSASFHHYRIHAGDLNSLQHDDIRYIGEDRNGTVWVGTNGNGLHSLDRASGLWTTYTRKDGLPDDRIYGVLEDSSGNLWISTQNGLCRFNPATKESKTYYESEGLQANEFNTGAFCRTADGRMAFGGIAGFNLFTPETITENRFIPPVVITGFTVMNQPMALNRAGVTLDHSQDYFRFEFTALSYLHSERNRYAFRLKGFDDQWHEVEQRTISYSGLKDGSYLFQVKACNYDGVWNEEGASVPITILPPFWRTWWFESFSTLVIIFAGTLTYRRKIRTLRGEMRRQEEFSRLLIANVERERKRIAGEIHDSIGQNLVVLKSMVTSAFRGTAGNPAVQEILQNASDLVSQTVQDTRTVSYNLHPMILDELGLTKALLLMTRKACETAGIRHQMDIPDVKGIFSPEEELHVFRIIQESVSNVIKHAGATELIVFVRREFLKIIVTVEDNGLGIAPDGNHSESSTPRGFGMQNMQERARLLGGNLSVTSVAGEGTIVRLECPIRSRELS